MEGEKATFTYAPEIETNTVSILWHEPDRLADFLRLVDPQTHFVQPHLRIILEAINIAWGELASADFATVAQVIRELGKMEECGGLEGLNQVYSAGEPIRATNAEDAAILRKQVDVILADYVRMLQAYAENRAIDPARPIYPLTGGRGRAIRNKLKRFSGQPDFIGEATIAGKKYKMRLDVSADGNEAQFRFNPMP
jgi:hypothetical protein